MLAIGASHLLHKLGLFQFQRKNYTYSVSLCQSDIRIKYALIGMKKILSAKKALRNLRLE